MRELKGDRDLSRLFGVYCVMRENDKAGGVSLFIIYGSCQLLQPVKPSGLAAGDGSFSLIPVLHDLFSGSGRIDRTYLSPFAVTA